MWEPHRRRPPAGPSTTRRRSAQGRGEEFVSLCVVVLDTEAGALRYASAGHPPAWMPRSCSIRLSVALLLEKRSKAEECLTVHFLDDDLHFLENHLTAI